MKFDIPRDLLLAWNDYDQACFCFWECYLRSGVNNSY